MGIGELAKKCHGIDVADRTTVCICIQVINTLHNAEGIGRQIPPHLRHVVTEPVLIQARLSVVVLPRESQVEEGGAGEGERFAEGFGLDLPDHCARGVCHHLRRAEVVAVDVPRAAGVDLG